MTTQTPSTTKPVQPTPLFIDYTVLQEFAIKNRVNYNELCSAVRKSLINAIQPASLLELDALAKLYSSSYSSPHHIVFTVNGLRNMIADLIQPQDAA